MKERILHLNRLQNALEEVILSAQQRMDTAEDIPTKLAWLQEIEASERQCVLIATLIMRLEAGTASLAVLV